MILASRVESWIGGQILATESTLQDAGEGVCITGQMEIVAKGVTAAMTVYDVGGIGAPSDRHLALRKDEPLVPLATPVGVRYLVLRDKRSSGEWQHGNLVALSSRMGRIRVARPRRDGIREDGIRADGLLGIDLWGKTVASRDGASDASFDVWFMSVPEQVRATIAASATREPSERYRAVFAGRSSPGGLPYAAAAGGSGAVHRGAGVRSHRRLISILLRSWRTALELRGVEPQAILDRSPHAHEERPARVRDPSGCRGAVDAVERRNPIDPEPIDQLMAQQVAFAWGERLECRAERRLELAVEPQPCQIELRAGGGRDRVEIVHRDLAAVLALGADRDPNRRHLEPRGQRAAAVVLGDLRHAPGFADEEPHAHRLHDIGGSRGVQTPPDQHRGQPGQVVLIEHDRLSIPAWQAIAR